MLPLPTCSLVQRSVGPSRFALLALSKKVRVLVGVASCGVLVGIVLIVVAAVTGQQAVEPDIALEGAGPLVSVVVQGEHRLGRPDAYLSFGSLTDPGCPSGGV